VLFHKRILEWQAAHPNITWVGWGIVWTVVLVALFWPRMAVGWLADLTDVVDGASAHHWARELEKLGHIVRLMPASDVKAYVKRNKNDAADAAAICVKRYADQRCGRSR
jgi:hypothetical protein